MAGLSQTSQQIDVRLEHSVESFLCNLLEHTRVPANRPNQKPWSKIESRVCNGSGVVAECIESCCKGDNSNDHWLQALWTVEIAIIYHSSDDSHEQQRANCLVIRQLDAIQEYSVPYLIKKLSCYRNSRLRCGKENADSHLHCSILIRSNFVRNCLGIDAVGQCTTHQDTRILSKKIVKDSRP